MPRPLPTALTDVRELLLDIDGLVRAVASGRRHGVAAPAVERVELRPVQLRGGLHLQVLSRTGPRVGTRNLQPAAAGPEVDALLSEPFGNWHVETTTATLQLRVTKRGDAQVHRSAADRRPDRDHDRTRRHLLDPGDPLFAVLGAGGDKRRQVDAFVRILAADADAALPRDPELPLRVADLGCGNAYLSFGAHRWLSDRAAEHGRAVHTVGVDVRADVVARSTDLAGAAGLPGLRFLEATIGSAEPFGQSRPDVVLALHACDTATDDALARAVRWGTPLVLAAPCCHRDVQRQLRAAPDSSTVPFPALTRHPILRERFADVLTDTLRALVMRLLGYRVDVVEFVDSRHTPRNALLRAVHTGGLPSVALAREYRDLTDAWAVRPALADRLRAELEAALTAAV